MGERKGMRRPLLPDTIAPGWLVVQVLGTLFIAATLITTPESSPSVWTCYAVSAAGWVVFVVTEQRWPRFGAGLLGVAAVPPAVALGSAADSSALILAVIMLGRFATLVSPSVVAITLISVVDMALAFAPFFAGRSSGWEALGNASLMLVVVLFGLNRRQYEVQATQTELLLEQTRRAQTEQARAAALDERTRIAREIHDVLAHSLGALGVQLELAEALLSESQDVDAALVTIRRSRRLAADGLAEARNAVVALRRDVPSLTDALEALADGHRGDHQVAVHFTPAGAAHPVSSGATVSLVATAREALTNAAKHSPGAEITMSLDFSPEAVRLRVRNDLQEGSATTPSPGYGLAGMRERLALAGGTLTSGRADGAWEVTAEVVR
jgi:signal transduction histidine kinase